MPRKREPSPAGIRRYLLRLIQERNVPATTTELLKIKGFQRAYQALNRMSGFREAGGWEAYVSQSLQMTPMRKAGHYIIPLRKTEA